MSTVVVGLSPGERGDAAVHLASLVARSLHASLVVAAITPEPWPPSPILGDEKYLQLQRQSAEEALAAAREIIDSGQVDAEYVVETARSVTDGLLQVSERHRTGLVVLGSGTSGRPGRVSVGSVAQRLLHSLDAPICIAPAGFSVPADARLSRVTVGFGRADRDSGLLTAAVQRAADFGIPLRVACFAVRPSIAARGTIESSADDLVVGEWAEQVRAEIRYAAGLAGADADSLEIVVGSGLGWEQAISALSWTPTDLLAVGAKTSTISRFLLGSHAAKIVKHSPVPVLTVARESLPT